MNGYCTSVESTVRFLASGHLSLSSMDVAIWIVENFCFFPINKTLAYGEKYRMWKTKDDKIATPLFDVLQSLFLAQFCMVIQKERMWFSMCRMASRMPKDWTAVGFIAKKSQPRGIKAVLVLLPIFLCWDLHLVSSQCYMSNCLLSCAYKLLKLKNLILLQNHKKYNNVDNV